MAILKDSYGRKIDYARISLTEECNLFCSYCRSKEDNLSIDKSGYLSLEEWQEYIRTLACLGIDKIKLTGGEPLLYPRFMELLTYLKEELKLPSVTLTTNALLLDKFLLDLSPQNIDGINISLDALDEEVFEKVTGRKGASKVYESILACVQKGIKTKINTVILSGVNDKEIIKLVGLAKDYPLALRFIEMMPLGRGKDYELKESQLLLEEIENLYGSFEVANKKIGNGPAIYYQRDDFKGVIGFIEPMSHQFCHECNRIRINASGELQLCLAHRKQYGAKELLTLSLDERIEKLREIIQLKPLQHHFHKKEKQEDGLKMWRIGG